MTEAEVRRIVDDQIGKALERAVAVLFNDEREKFEYALQYRLDEFFRARVPFADKARVDLAWSVLMQSNFGSVSRIYKAAEKIIEEALNVPNIEVSDETPRE